MARNALIRNPAITLAAIQYGCAAGADSESVSKRKNPAAVALGKLGGRAKSDAKTKAAQKNAKKGGWPKGRKRKVLGIVSEEHAR